VVTEDAQDDARRFTRATDLHLLIEDSSSLLILMNQQRRCFFGSPLLT